MRTTPLYHSQIFWHFCGRNKSEDEAYATLCKILQEKVLYNPNIDPLQGPPLIDEYGKKTPTLQPQHACFADIPFPFLKHHIGNYGNIGIGFKREYLINKGGQPVIYVAQMPKKRKKKFPGWTASSIIENLHKEFVQLEKLATEKLTAKDKTRLKALRLKLEILRHLIKQFSVNDPKSAYYEREWRVINSFPFELNDIEIVIIPRRFVCSFVKNFPEIPYSIAELIVY